MPASATASITTFARISCSSTCSSASRGLCHLATGSAAAPRMATLRVIELSSHQSPNPSSTYNQGVGGYRATAADDDGIDVDLIDDIPQVMRELGQPADGIDQSVDVHAR